MIMLNKLRAFFTVEPEQTEDHEAAIHLAAAVLLIEVAKSDHSVEKLELEQLKGVLRQEWGLSDADLSDLVDVARDKAERETSLHQQIDLINRNFDMPRKHTLMQGLWRVACADGEIHPYEELLIRRLADLLYVSHSDFIRTKHLALETSGDA